MGMTKLERGTRRALADYMRRQGYVTYAGIFLKFDLNFYRPKDGELFAAAMVPNKYRILINPIIDDKETLSMLIRHEILHEYLKHQNRLLKHLAETSGQNFDDLDDLSLKQLTNKLYANKLFNIAGDYEISNRGYTENDKDLIRNIGKALKLTQEQAEKVRGLVTEDEHPDWVNLPIEDMYDLLQKEREKEKQKAGQEAQDEQQNQESNNDLLDNEAIKRALDLADKLTKDWKKNRSSDDEGDSDEPSPSPGPSGDPSNDASSSSDDDGDSSSNNNDDSNDNGGDSSSNDSDGNSSSSNSNSNSNDNGSSGNSGESDNNNDSGSEGGNNSSSNSDSSNGNNSSDNNSGGSGSGNDGQSEDSTGDSDGSSNGGSSDNGDDFDGSNSQDVPGDFSGGDKSSGGNFNNDAFDGSSDKGDSGNQDDSEGEGDSDEEGDSNGSSDSGHDEEGDSGDSGDEGDDDFDNEGPSGVDLDKYDEEELEKQDKEREEEIQKELDELEDLNPDSEEAKSRLEEIADLLNDQAVADDLFAETDKFVRQDRKKRREQQKRAEAAASQYTANNGIDDFVLDLNKLIKKEVKKTTKSDWGRFNKKAEGSGLIKPGKASKKNPMIPRLFVYFDQSGSWGYDDIKIGEQAIATLNTYVKKKQLVIELYYFADTIHTDAASARQERTTRAGKHLIDHIKTNRPDNIVIMTDGDFDHWGEILDAGSVTVPGGAFLLFRGGVISKRLIDRVKGKKLTKIYKF